MLKRTLIFAFLLAGFAWSFSVSAATCPQDNGAGVGCNAGNGQYYCSNACRQLTTLTLPTLNHCQNNFQVCAPGADCSNSAPANYPCGVPQGCNSGYTLCNAAGTGNVSDWMSVKCKLNSSTPAGCSSYNQCTNICGACGAGYELSGGVCIGATVKLGTDSVLSDRLINSANPLASIFSTGNFSIGTTSSVSKLYVDGLIKSNNFLISQPEDVVNKSYLDSALASTGASLWSTAVTGGIYNVGLGNVGIGTTAPATPLHISKNGAGNVVDLLIQDTDTTANDSNQARLRLTTAGDINGGVVFGKTVASSPTYAGAAYFWNSENTAFMFATNATERMRISAGGNVGIGTTNPLAALDIFGKIKNTSGGVIYNTDNGRWLDMSGVLGDSLRVSGDLYSTAGNLKIAGTGNSYVMGSVGIGTTAPTLGRLQIAGSNDTLALGDRTGHVYASMQSGAGFQGLFTFYDNTSAKWSFGKNTDNAFVIYDNAATRYALQAKSNGDLWLQQSGGNVGIGTTSPGSPLEVVGDIKTSTRIFQQAGSDLSFAGANVTINAYNIPSSHFYVQNRNAASALVNKLDIPNQSNVAAVFTGNVGIGTTTPASTLDVNGVIKMRNATITQPEDVVNKSYLDSIVGASAPTVGFWTRSGNDIFNANTGNVGIGTTNPLSKLSINGGLHVGGDSDAGDNNILADGTISAATGASGGFRSTTYTAGQNLIWAFGNASGYGFSYKQGWPDDIRFHFGDFNNPQFLINQSGNVGIGTTNPSTALDVYGKVKTTSGGIIYNTDSGRWLDMSGVLGDSLRVSGDLYSTAGNLKIAGTGNSYVMGSVGIGTTNPGVKLEVVGNIAIQDQIIFDVNTNAGATGYINYGGYLSGNTQFRDLFIGNGKYASVLYAQGSTGNVGIGTTAPRTKLELGGDGAILAIGTLTSGWVEPNLGAGTRMMWYPNKAAFRTGIVDGAQWNNASIGYYSVAMGRNGTASGNTSFAIGYGGVASGSMSAATGFNTIASGDYSTTLGQYTTASSFNSFVIGRYNVGGGNTTSWVATDPLFEVGIGTGTGASAANALTILKNGNIGINTSTPSAKLDVNGTFRVIGALNSTVIESLKNGGAGGMVMADGSGTLSVAPAQNGSASFVAMTVTTYNGSQGGYVAANASCNAVSTGSHVCTSGEIFNTINTGHTADIPINSTLWINSGPPGYTANANDCMGRTSLAATDYGTVWVKGASGDGFGSLQTCNGARKYSCCK